MREQRRMQSNIHANQRGGGPGSFRKLMVWKPQCSMGKVEINLEWPYRMGVKFTMIFSGFPISKVKRSHSRLWSFLILYS
jgi:hypothetical protein